MLAAFDAVWYLFVSSVIIFVYPSNAEGLLSANRMVYALAGFVCCFGYRLLFDVYRKIWRYAAAREYIILIASDLAALVTFLLVRRFIPGTVTFLRSVSLMTGNLLGALTMRHFYQFLYHMRGSSHPLVLLSLKLLKLVTGVSFHVPDTVSRDLRIKVAIVGAGNVGVMLADELLRNSKAVYQPVCFVDVNTEKVGRSIYGIDVLDGASDLKKELNDRGVQEIIFALPNVDVHHKRALYDIYAKMGYKVKTYDYPTLESAEGGVRNLRDFHVEDLLFRRSASVIDEQTAAWYRGKNVLITGGGGSIGSELARQIAKMEPSRLVILDIYENGAYEIQQELKIKYGDRLNLRVEIANVCNRSEMEKIFSRHTPDIVLHAAAHKHVPLMERNCCEAVRNNVFGTLVTVETCEKFGVKRFIMISTDKAVNPTNVMGATKRMCEMIVQSRTGSATTFSATRFGNVLGSNGSVIPLFRKQLANGGPLTITDKRIVRYFMTIPEASQLVLISGAMAKNGELYALDMGNPIRILDLAENMIRLSGLEPYRDIDIVETGLREGEKLYEELLIKTEDLDRTSNNLIFVERDKPLPPEEIEQKLRILREALETESNSAVKAALMQVVPTYHAPEEVNSRAIEAEEMKLANAQQSDRRKSSRTVAP